MAEACVNDTATGAERCCTTRRGYDMAYKTDYRDAFEAEIRECAANCKNKDECVVLTGHSQGGAIAALSSVYLADLNPYVVTFGQPYTVDAPCDQISSERFYRFINTKFGYGIGISYDPIPFMPGRGADAFGHMIILSDDDGSVAYMGLDCQDTFGPLNVNGFEAHSMVGTEAHPGYLDRVNKLVEKGSFPVATYGYKAESPCSEDRECETGKCAKETSFAYKKCVGSQCVVDSDCEDTGRCDSGMCLPKLGSCMACDEDSDCSGGLCLLPEFRCSGEGGLMDDKCNCNMESDCLSGRCEGIIPRLCEAQLGVGCTCNENSDCKSDICLGFRCEGVEGEHGGGRKVISNIKVGIYVVGVIVAIVGGWVVYRQWLYKRSEYESIGTGVVA